MTTSPNSVGEILDCLEELTGECDSVSVDRILNAFGTRTYGPAIMVPALLEITPVGAIPGVPTFLAVTIILVAAQKLFGKRHLWMPKLIRDRCVSAEKLGKGTKKLRRLAEFLDRHFHRRLKFMTRAPFAQIAAGMVILLCLSVPFLEVLPFASSVPMLAVAGFGLAILVRDGVLMMIALAASLAAAGAMGYDHLDGGLSDTEAVDGLVEQEDVDAVRQTAGEAGERAEEIGDAAQETAREMGDDLSTAAEETAREIETETEEALRRD